MEFTEHNMKKTSTGWIVGDKFFRNKWHAIDYHVQNPQLAYSAYCNDDELDKWDWVIEPEESIEKLSAQRAIELREKYKTLVLCYSGGADSAAVLHTFMENKIPIEYIIMYHAGDDRSVSYNLDSQVVEKYLTANKDKLLGAKVIYERKPDPYEGNCIFSHIPGESISKINEQLTWHHSGYQSIVRLRNPDIYEKVQDNGCIITGGNKPFLYKDEGGWYCQYNDWDEESWGGDLEMFFVGHTKLCVKQAHLAKHWLLKHPDVVDTNTIYKIPDRDGKFKDLNASFGRVFIDERFYIKPTMRGLDWLYNEFGDFKWNKDVTLYRWYLEYPNWKDSESYKDLAKQYQWYKDHTDFVGESNKLKGWLSKKRYLQ